MTFWQCFYHVVWATKERYPFIDEHMARLIADAIREKSSALGAPVLAVGTMPDYGHVAVTIPPRLAVSGWVGQVKGISSHEVNAALLALNPRFAWQSEYGVVTFGAKNTEQVIHYILHQHEHHEGGTAHAYLETIED